VTRTTWTLRLGSLLLAGALLSTPAHPLATASAPAAAPEDELPEGDGKTILKASCATCHELTEVTKFRGYFTRKQWHDIVVTMVEYGAVLKDGESEVLVDYLTEHLGKKDSEQK
jgi:hypothetical protein